MPPDKKGVYVIYDSKNNVAHVGRTPRTKYGISQRLKDHLYGRPSFTYNYLDGDGEWLRGRFKFNFIIVRSSKIRACLEAYAIGSLCPAHIGVG
jgi:hypothetical protein